jgi:2-C-methyl-D-erythritol 4-phosphate cytidylyltransferase
MSKFGVILPAAGSSTRFKRQPRKKPFVEIAGRAVWLRAADPFLNHPRVAQVIVVISPADEEWFHTEYGAHLAAHHIDVAVGGAERADSVGNALALLRPEIEFVAVHDAARPVLAVDWVNRVFDVAERDGAALLATPITSTIKRGGPDGRVVETVPRAGLWAAQTPQVFRRSMLEGAYAQRGSLQPTDEASLVESSGQPVTLVEGSPLNIKITADDDLRFAELALQSLPQPTPVAPESRSADR